MMPRACGEVSSLTARRKVQQQRGWHGFAPVADERHRARLRRDAPVIGGTRNELCVSEATARSRIDPVRGARRDGPRTPILPIRSPGRLLGGDTGTPAPRANDERGGEQQHDDRDCSDDEGFHRRELTCSLVRGQISLARAKRAMCSPARNASAWIVIVGCPRPEVTKLEPSQMKRLRTSWLR